MCYIVLTDSDLNAELYFTKEDDCCCIFKAALTCELTLDPTNQSILNFVKNESHNNCMNLNQLRPDSGNVFAVACVCWIKKKRKKENRQLWKHQCQVSSH